MKNSLGFRLETPDKTIVISGDTGPSENLVHFAKDADILIHEAYLPGIFSGRSGEPQRASQNLSRYHTTAEQAGEIATRANVKQLVIMHVIPGNQADKIYEFAAKTFKGKVTVGADLMRFSP